VARVLLVGCGCRGRDLAVELRTRGHAVRGTTRNESRLPEIWAAGADGVVANPDRLATLVPHLDGVSVLCWLMGSATGDAVAELHGARLEALLETLVDTHVRGVVYEGVGSVEPRLLEQGAALVARAADTWRMPVEVVEAHGTPAIAAAVERVLAA
jgi:putative NADH-flavin reductase